MTRRVPVDVATLVACSTSWAPLQYHAWMHERAAVDAAPVELAAYVRELRVALGPGRSNRSTS